MSDPRTLFVGEIGKRIKVSVGMSLANLSAAILRVMKPDGVAEVDWTLIVLGATDNGVLYHDAISGDLSVQGIYRAYAKLTFSDGRIYYGERGTFHVFDPSEG